MWTKPELLQQLYAYPDFDVMIRDVLLLTSNTRIRFVKQREEGERREEKGCGSAEKVWTVFFHFLSYLPCPLSSSLCPCAHFREEMVEGIAFLCSELQSRYDLVFCFIHNLTTHNYAHLSQRPSLMRLSLSTTKQTQSADWSGNATILLLADAAPLL